MPDSSPKRPKITKQAEIVLSLAEATAAQRGAERVEDADVLHAIISHGQSVAAFALSELNVRAPNDPQSLSRSSEPCDVLDWTRDLSNNGFLSNVVEQSAQLGYMHAGPESLLLALMDRPNHRVDAILADVGVERSSVRDLVLEILGKK